jgi:hypothetical protein
MVGGATAAIPSVFGEARKHAPTGDREASLQAMQTDIPAETAEAAERSSLTGLASVVSGR